MAPSLEYCFTLKAYVSNDQKISIPAANAKPSRGFRAITGGSIEGSGLKAELIPGGGDWSLVRIYPRLMRLLLKFQVDPSTGNTQLDVRTQAKTANNESIYIQYTGFLKIDEAFMLILSGNKDAKSTNFGDHHWFCSPIFETSIEEFKWIESTTFVGQGRCVLEDGGKIAVEYSISKVIN